jgi:hypothetical protein
VAVVLYLLFFGTGIYSQVYRYRRVSGPVERQQMKWVVAGVIAAIVGFAIYYVPLVVSPAFADGTLARLVHLLVATPIFQLLVILAPAAITVAILRFRLWDVDALINRTLVYGSLTLGLVAVYFGAVILLQQVFIAFTGQRSDLALVASTLSIAAIFDPLRQTLQRAVDRRFYRRRYDAMQVLMSVGDTIREEVDLDHLADRLVSAVDEAMQPAHAEIWLVRSEDDDRVATAAPGATRRVEAPGLRS